MCVCTYIRVYCIYTCVCILYIYIYVYMCDMQTFLRYHAQGNLNLLQKVFLVNLGTNHTTHKKGYYNELYINQMKAKTLLLDKGVHILILEMLTGMQI